MIDYAAKKLELNETQKQRLGILAGKLQEQRAANALRFNPADGLPCAVSVGRETGKTVIRIRDHGPGVEASQLLHLTEPFFRTDASRQRSTGGVGLGLYLCKLVAQAHGGSLSIRNALPGLEVRVDLPTLP